MFLEEFFPDLTSECQRNRSWCQSNRTSVSISEPFFYYNWQWIFLDWRFRSRNIIKKCCKSSSRHRIFKKSKLRDEIFDQSYLKCFSKIFEKNNLVASIREELKLKTFDKEWLINNLNHKMLFFSFVIFIDKFELYKNVYHLMNDIYCRLLYVNWKNKKPECIYFDSEFTWSEIEECS